MSNWGTITDYTKGTPIRPATAAEWREGASKVNSDDSDAYTGVFFIEGDRDVYVDGGPDAEVRDSDISDLRDEADAAGDEKQSALCVRAMDGDDDARAECVRVILDDRMAAGVA